MALKPTSHSLIAEADGRWGHRRYILQSSWASTAPRQFGATWSPSRSDGACYCVEVTSFREKDSASPSDRRTLPPDFVLIGPTNECECELIFFFATMYQIPFLYVFTEGEDCLRDRPTHTSLGVNENVPPNASMAEPVRELHSYLLHLPSYSA